MFLVSLVKQLYTGFFNLQAIIRNVIRLHSITLPELENSGNVAVFKNDIISTGCIGIKLTQWYISHSHSINNARNQRIGQIFADVFDQCPYHDLAYTRAMVEQDFGTSADSLFDMELFKPIASGSIGQVYHTRMKHTNLEVAVKVKHPDVDANIATYVPCLKLIKKLQSYQFIRNWFKVYFDIEDFIANITLQCDFKNEVRNAQRFAENFENNEMVVIPTVHMFSNNIIVYKYESGVELADITSYQRYKAVLNLICFMKQTVVIDDFIHGDLHFKNWRFRVDNGKIKFVVYDFGICYNSGDLEFNRNFWNSFIDGDIKKFSAVINTMIVGNITPTIQHNIDQYTLETCEHFKKNKLSFSFFIENMIQLLYNNDITINKICLNLLITISVLEHIFQENNLLSYKDDILLDACEVIHQQRIEMINFCKASRSYSAILEYLENIEKTYKKQGKTFELFGSIKTSKMVFSPIEPALT